MNTEEIKSAAVRYATKSDGRIDLLEKQAYIAGAMFTDTFPILVYAFLYNPNESGYVTISIHRTRKGAEIALEHHRNECKKEWMEIMQTGEFSFGISEDWKVEEIQILP